MNKRIKIFILLSVLLNVLFTGLFFGLIFKHAGANINDDKTIEAILAKAPIPEDRRFFLENQLNTIFNNGHASHKDIENLREGAFKLLIAEPFDEAAYQAQVDKIFGMRQEQHKNISAAIKNLVKQLNPKERLALAEVLRGMVHKR